MEEKELEEKDTGEKDIEIEDTEKKGTGERDTQEKEPGGGESAENEIGEKEQQMQEAAEAIREDLKRIERGERMALLKGIVIGSLAMFALCMLTVFVIPAMVGRQSQEGGREAAVTEEDSILTGSVRSKIDLLTELIDMLYYEDVDEEDLVDGLYKGLFSGTGDIYSGYFTPEEYESFMISTTASLCGIGASLQQEAGTMQVVVKRVYEGSPAEKSGIKEGDRIVKVGDIVATTMELSELVTHIRGDKGTTVHLKIYREKEHDYAELDVERDYVDMPTVSGEMLRDGIGYILISEFGDKTGEEFSEAVKNLEKQGMSAMIVDLRDNPGGMITSVTEILDEILPKGVTVWTEDKAGNKEEYKSDASCMDYPMAVLINGGSASSSEIFAGAIRDYEYGTLIGTKTFGKGIVQSIRQLKDGSAFKITTARYFTPKGENIHGEGIAPDIELEYEYLNPDATEYDMMEDNQILKAIEVLKEK